MRLRLRSPSIDSIARPLLLSVAIFANACANSAAVGEASWPPVGKKWFDRADASFRQGDMDDARVAIDNALRVVPDRTEARLLSAKIALATLDYDRVLASLQGLESSDSRSIRGRAYWYAGDLDRAADELDKLLADPEVRDPWATEISRLARVGQGRKPFEVSGGLLAVTDMPRAGTTSLIVPLELNGEPALGLVATGTAEAVIDSSAGARPSWVSLRFGERLEVRDVPALAKDLSGISRQVNAPIKILLGVNLLRHLRPTFDFAGGQFVVRSFEPPPPPVATTVKLSYVRGGGMLLRGAFGAEPSAPACALLIDTSLTYPMALDSAAWAKAGVNVAKLQPVPGAADLREGVVPMLRLGAFEVPRIPGLQGDGVVKEREDGLGVDLDGLVGSGLLAPFRVTLADRGRTMWLEELPAEALNPPPLTIPPSDLDVPDEGADDADEGVAPAKGGKNPPGKVQKQPPAPVGPGNKIAPAPGAAGSPSPSGAGAPAAKAVPPASAPQAPAAGAPAPKAAPPSPAANRPTSPGNPPAAAPRASGNVSGAKP